LTYALKSKLTVKITNIICAPPAFPRAVPIPCRKALLYRECELIKLKAALKVGTV
jgi:hypothetical protein